MDFRKQKRTPTFYQSKRPMVWRDADIDRMKLEFQIFGERVSFFVYKFQMVVAEFHFLYTSFKQTIPSFMQKIWIAKIKKSYTSFMKSTMKKIPGTGQSMSLLLFPGQYETSCFRYFLHSWQRNNFYSSKSYNPKKGLITNLRMQIFSASSELSVQLARRLPKPQPATLHCASTAIA